MLLCNMCIKSCFCFKRASQVEEKLNKTHFSLKCSFRSEMVENGYVGMVGNGGNWWGIVGNGWEWLGMVGNGQEWSGMGGNAGECWGMLGNCGE